MLISPFCISQTSYPRKAVIDKDTVCILSIEQIRSVNKVFVDRDECYELRDSLNSEIGNYDILNTIQKAVIASQKKELDIQKKIIQEKDSIIQSDEKIIKKGERRQKWIKAQRNALAILSVGLGIAMLIL